MLRCNDDKARKLRFLLGAGDVLIMSGATQARIGSCLHTDATIQPGARVCISTHGPLAVVT